MHTALWGVVASGLVGLAGPGIAQQGNGLSASIDALGGARWQARFEHDNSALPVRGVAGPLGLDLSATQTLRLLRDYQFDTLRLGSTGGLRLTGGVLINLRSTGFAGAAYEPSPTLPYAGIGYATGHSLGNRGGGMRWDVSADLGLAANGLGLTLGNRAGGNGLAMDGNLRDLRLQPLLRLGMSLSF